MYDILFSVGLNYFTNSLTLVVSSNNLETEYSLILCRDRWKNIAYMLYRILTCTSSSFRIGILRTLYFWRSSLDRGADMILLLSCEEAVKCALRIFLLDEVLNLFSLTILIIICGLIRLDRVNITIATMRFYVNRNTNGLDIGV